jgi:hypothetical protein
MHLLTDLHALPMDSRLVEPFGLYFLCNWLLPFLFLWLNKFARFCDKKKFGNNYNHLCSKERKEKMQNILLY